MFLNACRDGSLIKVQTLVRNLDDINVRDKKSKMSGLHFAAEKGHLDIVIFLIRNGVDLKIVDKKKFSALHHAAFYGHTDIVELFEVVAIHNDIKKLMSREQELKSKYQFNYKDNVHLFL